MTSPNKSALQFPISITSIFLKQRKDLFCQKVKPSPISKMKVELFIVPTTDLSLRMGIASIANLPQLFSTMKVKSVPNVKIKKFLSVKKAFAYQAMNL